MYKLSRNDVLKHNELADSAAQKAYEKGLEKFINAANDQEEYLSAYLYFYRAYKLGLTGAAYYVAKCFQNGTGKMRSYKAANKYFLIYASSLPTDKAKQSEAYYILSQNYRLGHGVEANIESSNMFLTKSANSGNNQAQYELGARLLFGSEIAQDVKQGILFLKEATKQHSCNANSFVSGDAQGLLGWCYKEGFGVDKDLEKSEQYYLAAKAQGNYQGLKAMGENYGEPISDFSLLENKPYYSGEDIKHQLYISVLTGQCVVEKQNHPENDLTLTY